MIGHKCVPIKYIKHLLNTSVTKLTIIVVNLPKVEIKFRTTFFPLESLEFVL